MLQPQVDANLVIQNLKQKIADLTLELAVKDAMIQKMQQEVQAPQEQ